ncbi:hypothetical protein ACFL2O_00980 [Thermodesulfobacteriota bacterium]
MDYKDILTKKEAKILEEANDKARKLREKLEKPGPKIDKSEFSKAGKAKKIELLSESLAADHRNLWELIKTANEYYDALKSSMDEKDTTHEFITKGALNLLKIDDPGIWGELKPACMAPDREKKMWELAYEGHFFGKVRSGKFGNFMERVFGKYFLSVIDRVNDIDETAVSNFSKYYKQALDGNIGFKELGCAGHYLQDLTAPHHVGNMAIFFEMLTDNIGTHYIFEKYARKFVYDNPDSFTSKAKKAYEELKTDFNPNQPKNFTKEVYNRASKNIPLVMNTDLNSWDKAIKDAIPLAIGATAVVFEPLK